MLKFDPVDTFTSVGSTLVGRWLLFFSSGMVGLALGWMAGSFEEWEDFLHPMDVMDNLMAIDAGELLMWLALWPAFSLSAMASPWFCLFFALSVAIVFVVLIYTEEPAPLWWLGMVAISSLVPALREAGGTAWNGSSWLVLGIFWAGLGAIAYYVWQRDYSCGKDLLERMTGEDGGGVDGDDEK